MVIDVYTSVAQLAKLLLDHWAFAFFLNLSLIKKSTRVVLNLLGYY